MRTPPPPDPTTRPFSPSPPRENRHTVSRPPSLLLGAGAPGTVTTSNSFDLAGLPATPPISQRDIDGLPSISSNYFEDSARRIRLKSDPHQLSNRDGDQSIAEGRFVRGRSVSLHSSPDSRDSISSTSSSSPPLGATSLLASLSNKIDTLNLDVHTENTTSGGTPKSTHSRASSHSTNSRIVPASRSLPRLHQPTVVRKTAGRGIAFLPPPAQVSPSNSTFTIHQPSPDRHNPGLHRNRTTSHGSVTSINRHPFRSNGDHEHARATSPAGETVVQRLTSLAETFPERKNLRPGREFPELLISEGELNEVNSMIPISNEISDEDQVMNGPPVESVSGARETLADGIRSKSVDLSRLALGPLLSSPSSPYSAIKGEEEYSSEPSLHEISPKEKEAETMPEAVVLPTVIEHDLDSPRKASPELPEPSAAPREAHRSTPTTQDGQEETTDVLPYKPRRGAKTFPSTEAQTMNHNESFAFSFYAALSTSNSLPQQSGSRLEITLAWLDSTRLSWIPGSRLIPSWNLKLVGGTPSNPTIIDPRAIVRGVVMKLPIVWRLAAWL